MKACVWYFVACVWEDGEVTTYVGDAQAPLAAAYLPCIGWGG